MSGHWDSNGFEYGKFLYFLKISVIVIYMDLNPKRIKSDIFIFMGPYLFLYQLKFITIGDQTSYERL